MLTVPNTSILICDICGYHEIGINTLNWIDIFVEHSEHPAIVSEVTTTQRPSQPSDS